jgi:[ribosomal protein S5]-alanine N-acetyltransferase
VVTRRPAPRRRGAQAGAGSERSPSGSSLVLPIVTRRLVLRDFAPADLAAVHAYAADAEVTRFMFYGPRSEVETRTYLDRVLVSQGERPRRTWELAVIERDTGRLVGSCDLTLDGENAADLGYVFQRSCWGSGFATESARAMVRAGFEQLALDRIFAMCDESHGASRRVLEKAGLRCKGMLAGVRQAKGRSWDMWHYELLRDEWTSARAGVS